MTLRLKCKLRRKKIMENIYIRYIGIEAFEKDIFFVELVFLFVISPKKNKLHVLSSRKITYRLFIQILCFDFSSNY